MFTTRCGPMRAALGAGRLVRLSPVSSVHQHARLRALASASAVQSASSNDIQSVELNAPAVVLEVGGMKCGGCSAAVKRMLMARPDVESAAVNLLTETAAVKFKGDPLSLGPEAAGMLTSKGFPAKVRPAGGSGGVLGGTDDEVAAKAAARQAEAARAKRNLLAAWGLAAVSLSHHAGHILHLMGQHDLAHSPVLILLGNPVASGVLGAAALLGPGRELLVEGFRSLAANAPNMNSLVAVGCTTSFMIGSLSWLFPSWGLGFDASFLEEPVMLLAFVLLGRALEANAKVQAASDLTALASLLPATCRLVLDPGAAPGAAKAGAAPPPVECIEVPTTSARPGDIIRVLPGEKVPVDGVVVAGRAAADESLLTGESRLVPKDIGSSVTGGTVNYEGALDIRATNTGSQSTLAGLARLVSEAQSKEAPVQRLADEVAGRFCYGVMASAALTFGFWSLFGAQAFPQVLEPAAFAESMTDWAAMSSAMHHGGAWGSTTVSATSGGGLSAWLDSLVAALPAPAEEGGPLTPLLLAVRLAVDVLVVACPCALGLATPTAVLVASSMGARRGLLLRGGGEVLERLAGVKAVALDKTGTVTYGRMHVTSIQLTPTASSRGTTADSLLAQAAALEAATRHPLAQAVLAEATARGLQLPTPDTVEGRASVVSEPGAGVWGTVQGMTLFVGKHSWVSQQVRGASVPAAGSSSTGHTLQHMTASEHSPATSSVTTATAVESSSTLHTSAWDDVNFQEQEHLLQDIQGCSTIWIGQQGVGMLGVISARDTIREDAKHVVQQLQDRGIGVHMLSGDSQQTVTAVAAQAGIPAGNAVGAMTPQQKLQTVEALRQRYGSVAMVGDGVNDAPALASADVGVAMQGGLDAAGEASKVVLMGDRLSQLVEAVDLGRATLAKIKANLAWALAYNAVGIPLAAGVLLPQYGVSLNPSMAAAMMAFSSVAVVSNSLLLRLQFPAASKPVPQPQEQQQQQQQAASTSSQ